MEAMFAVIKLGGTQHLVKEKQVFRTQKLAIKEGDKLTVSEVLMTHGNAVKLGTPYVSGASVELKVRSHGKEKKIKVFKMKSKKRYKRTLGHKQPYSEVEVTKITA